MTFEELRKLSVQRKNSLKINAHMRGEETCSKKRKYKTETGAIKSDKAIINLQRNENGMRKKKIAAKRAYKCPHCGFWHLTSRI